MAQRPIRDWGRVGRIPMVPVEGSTGTASQLRAEVTGLGTGMRTDMTRWRTDMIQLRADMTQLRTDMETGFTAVDARFDQVDARFDHVDGEIRMIKDQLAS